MKYPAGSKGRRRKTRIKTPKLPAYPKSAGLGDRGTRVLAPVVPDAPSAPATPAAPSAPTTPSGPTTPAPKTGATSGDVDIDALVKSGADPWTIAKAIVDADIAAQTKVIEGQKSQVQARNQAILNTFLGFQAALSKLSGTLGPQFDASMKDLGNSQAAFQQGFQDASSHIDQTKSMTDTARSANPFWQLPGNLASQGQLLGAVQAKQMNDQLSQYDLQIQGLSGNRMKDIFSLYSGLQQAQTQQVQAAQAEADKMTNLSGNLWSIDKDGNPYEVRVKGKAIPMPGTTAYRNLTARQKAQADQARQQYVDQQNSYFKFANMASKLVDDTGVLWLPKPDGTGIYQAKDEKGNPIQAPGSTAARNAALSGQYGTSQFNSYMKTQAANMTKADPAHVYTYNPSTGSIDAIPRTQKPKAPKQKPTIGATQQAINRSARTDLWTTKTITDPTTYKTTTTRVPRMSYANAVQYLFDTYKTDWRGSPGSLKAYIKNVLFRIGIKPPKPKPALGPPSPYG